MAKYFGNPDELNGRMLTRDLCQNLKFRPPTSRICVTVRLENMAHASAKRIGEQTGHIFIWNNRVNQRVYLANQNEAAIRTLRLGMIVPTIISLLLRFLLRKDTLPPSKGSLAIYIVTFFPAFFLSNYLVKIGTTRRDPTTGTLISYGEDLSQTGVTEWCFDILYVTC